MAHDPHSDLHAWGRILRDTAITGCGAFCFVYGGIMIRDPTLLAIFFGAGATLLGVPPYLRRGDRNGNGGGDKNGGGP